MANLLPLKYRQYTSHMKKSFTDEDAAALVDRTAELAKTTATDDKGLQPLVS